MLMQDIFALCKLAQLHTSRWLKDYGITSSEHSVLVYQAMHKSSNQERIAQYMLLDKGTITRILCKLEAKALVLRSPNPQNRRENLIALTDAGQALVEELAAISEQLGQELRADIPPEDAAVFESVLLRLRQNAYYLVHQQQKEAAQHE